MNWDAISAISELLAAIGVIATLFYLSGQIRQNTKSNISTTTESIAKDIHEFSMTIFKDKDASRILREYVQKNIRLADVSEEDKFLVHLFLQSAFTLSWRAYDQYKNGQASEESWNVIFSIIERSYCTSKTVQDWFVEGRNIYPQEFIDLIDSHWRVE